MILFLSFSFVFIFIFLVFSFFLIYLFHFLFFHFSIFHFFLSFLFHFRFLFLFSGAQNLIFFGLNCLTISDTISLIFFLEPGICVDPPLCRGTSQGLYGSRFMELVCKGETVGKIGAAEEG